MEQGCRSGSWVESAHGGVRVALGGVRRSWAWVRSRRRRWTYPLGGTVLVLCAPLGLLLVQALAAGKAPSLGGMAGDLALAPVTYAYLAISTTVVSSCLGYLLGRSSDRLHLLSITDPLTGLFNRRHFVERVAEEMRRGRRYGRMTCVLCVDIDKLKGINDHFGHQAGDEAILAVSRSLVSNLRDVDSVARMGGDEFAVLLPETSARQANQLSRRIVGDVSRITARSGRLGVSVGVAAAAALMGTERDDPLARADAALYLAKAAGGSRAMFSGQRAGALDSCRASLPGNGPWTLAEAVQFAGGEPDVDTGPPPTHAAR